MLVTWRQHVSKCILNVQFPGKASSGSKKQLHITEIERGSSKADVLVTQEATGNILEGYS